MINNEKPNNPIPSPVNLNTSVNTNSGAEHTNSNLVPSSLDLIPNQGVINYKEQNYETNNNANIPNIEEKVEENEKKIKALPEVNVENQAESYIKDYQRFKGKGKKKQKYYKYSKSKLASLEKEKKLFLEDLKKEGATRLSKPVIYLYKVKDKFGKITTNSIKGLSKLDVNAFLLSEGYEVISIKTSDWIQFAYKDASILGSSKMSSKDLVFFLTQLHTYLKAGLTLSNSMDILSKQLRKGDKKATAYKAISFELSLGENFSDALQKQGEMFPSLLINMIKAAEASGSLIETLDDMVSYYTDMDSSKKQMKSALTYPIVILVFSIAVVIFVLIYVIPEFTALYSTNEAEIGTLTKIILSASDFLTKYLFHLILGVFAFIACFIFLYKKVKAFKTRIQILIMKTPVFKDVIIYNELAIFSKTFSSLLKNNVYITDSVDILTKITTNEIYKGILHKTISNIVKGEKISEAFNDHWAVPDVAYFMIVTGESTGELANMMQKVATYYQEMHKTTVDNMKALLEPALTCFLAVIVGLIIIAVIVPMYDSMGSLLG